MSEDSGPSHPRPFQQSSRQRCVTDPPPTSPKLPRSGARKGDPTWKPTVLSEWWDYPPPSDKAVESAIAQAVAGYKRLLGPRLAQVWLFGSRATGTHRPDSDVDLLAVLHHELPSIISDLDLLCSVAAPIRHSSGVFIDGHPTTLERLEASDDDFHYFVRHEGRRVDA